MAQGPAQALGSLTRGFLQLSNAQKIALLGVLAGLAAAVSVTWMWLGTPEYRVLFSNLSDRDGGDVIAALAAQNVPYRVAQGGSAILVPEERVYELRLQLATQGLPRGGAVGFELMDTQRFGISQFAEQVNYQRALAGELARTVESMASVQQARVHLAIPRPSVFVRDEPRPSASVLVAMYPGRTLDTAQVSAIQHLVASSVPELPARNVTIVDQAGNLMSSGAGEPLQSGLNASQLKYVQEVERNYAAGIENILTPLVGHGNVRAQVRATLDFTEVNQTSESFAPNGTPAEAAIRSQQTIETTSVAPSGPSGVPGALSNQPPGAASAPLTSPPPAASPARPAAIPQNTHRENVVNYEVGKTIVQRKGEIGTVKRLSAAVVVNFRPQPAADGSAGSRPLSNDELAQANALVREAMGFSQERGDTVNLVNAPFSSEPLAGVEPPSPWSDTVRWVLSPSGVVTLGKYLLLIVVIVLALSIARSALREVARGAAAREAARAEPTLAPAGEAAGAPVSAFDADLQAVRDMARQEPRIVANVVKDWVGRGE